MSYETTFEYEDYLITSGPDYGVDGFNLTRINYYTGGHTKIDYEYADKGMYYQRYFFNSVGDIDGYDTIFGPLTGYRVSERTDYTSEQTAAMST